MLKQTVRIEKPGNASWEQAAWKLRRPSPRLQAEADSLKVARTKTTLGALLAKWLPRRELDETTRMNYASQISWSRANRSSPRWISPSRSTCANCRRASTT